MKTFCITLALLISGVLVSQDEQSGKHLIIMSGQSNMVHLDPEETLLPALRKEFGYESILLVKDAKGTQPNSRWYIKAKVQPKEKKIGDLYDRVIRKVMIAKQDVFIKSVTFIWMQGECDAKLGNADVYEDYLIGLYDRLSKDLKREDINFIIGRLNDFDMTNTKWSNWTRIRDIQVKVAESNPRFDWVDADNFNTGIGLNGKQFTDDIHMTKDGYKQLGRAFAQKTIKLINLKN